jgi:hypothetical protein
LSLENISKWADGGRWFVRHFAVFRCWIDAKFLAGAALHKTFTLASQLMEVLPVMKTLHRFENKNWEKKKGIESK